MDAVFGYRGTISDDIAPSSDVITEVLRRTNDPLTVWQAIILRAYGQRATAGLPTQLHELAEWFAANKEIAERRIQDADALLDRPLVILFDALDTLANEWSEIRRRTEGLLRLAVLAKGLRKTRVKIFMRPDQLEDTSLFRFPDASKLRAERVDLQWTARDLYALLFFHLRAHHDTITDLLPPIYSQSGGPREWLEFENAQRTAFEAMAGTWMGRDRKRGSTYSWLVQHLADARGETTPRGFLTALRAAGEYGSSVAGQAIDFRGIQHGVAEASENRVDDLRQDYWWVEYVRSSLGGLETPIERERLFEVWRNSHTIRTIRNAAPTRGLLPIFLVLRASVDELPQEVASLIDSDEAALLQSLRLIGVAEVRSNGKVNVPDIFRVAFKMKRRGGVPPKRHSV